MAIKSLAEATRTTPSLVSSGCADPPELQFPEEGHLHRTFRPGGRRKDDERSGIVPENGRGREPWKRICHPVLVERAVGEEIEVDRWSVPIAQRQRRPLRRGNSPSLSVARGKARVCAAPRAGCQVGSGRALRFLAGIGGILPGEVRFNAVCQKAQDFGWNQPGRAWFRTPAIRRFRGRRPPAGCLPACPRP